MLMQGSLDAIAGRDLRENVGWAIWNYDKMILACSINSLTSGPVDREIETALQKEDRLKAAAAQAAKEALAARREPPYVDTDVLVPVRVDDTIFSWTSPWLPKSGDATFRTLLLRCLAATNTGVSSRGLSAP